MMCSRHLANGSHTCVYVLAFRPTRVGPWWLLSPKAGYSSFVGTNKATVHVESGDP